MEGSTVRGQDRIGIAQLNQATDLQNFQAEFSRQLAASVPQAEVFFGLMDLSSKGLHIPSWVRTHLDAHPDLYKKLELGELVGISLAEANPGPRPGQAARASVVLIPVLQKGVLYGAVGLVLPLDGSPVPSEEIETLRQFAHDAGPIAARIIELEQLRRENRELMCEKKLLDVAQRMRSHMESNLAHELRTPLAAIRGYARMILDGRSGEITDTQKEYLRVVTENTDRLIHLVSWMSHVSELTEQDFELSTFDLVEVWRDCVKASQAELKEKSVTLTQMIPTDSFVITGDRKKFAAAFVQLVAAAVRLTRHEGHISAEFSHGRNGEITVKIAEDGPGIAPQVLRRIFDSSYTGYPARTSPPPDNAVSLSGVYDVVGLHGGRMFVNSPAGKGSTFLFTLPAVRLDGEEKLA